MRWPTVALVLAAALTAAVGCSTTAPPAGGEIAVTLVPAGAPTAAGAAWSYPEGSRVVRLGAGPDARPRELSAGLAAAGGPDVSPDARRVLFAGQASASGPWGIYETALGDRSPQTIWLGDTDCAEPAYLAHGAIVFSCAVSGDPSLRALYVLSPERSGLERITWGPATASAPTPLADGRILFAMEITDAAGARAGTELYTVNADGSLLEAFGGNHARGVSRSRPRQAHDGGVLFLAADDGASTRLFGAPITRPEGATRLELPAHAGRDDASVLSAEPDGEGMLIVAADGSGSRVVRLGPEGDAEVLSGEIDGFLPLEAVPLRPSAPPRGRPRIVAESGSTGFLVGYDAARSDGIVGPIHGGPSPRAAQFRVQQAGQTLLLASADGVDASTVAPLRPDRSYFFEVPADVPLRVTTLDGAGETIATSAWFWVRPGETRACFGCHEGHAAAPVNRPIDAITGPPVRLEVALEVLTAATRSSALEGGR